MQTLDEALASVKIPFELTELQREDVQRLVTHYRVLADLPVGYGKTVISTVAALMLECETTVVAVPPVLVPQWVRWLRQIGITDVLAYDATLSPAKRSSLTLPGRKWIVTTHALIRQEAERWLKAFAGRSVYVIFDEAQALRDHSSKISKAIRDFCSNRPVALMSGTPISKPSHAYSYIRMCNPQIYRSYGQFENIHVATRNFFGAIETWQNLDLLSKTLDLVRIHREESEVNKGRPKGIYKPIYYELKKPHLELYRKLMNERLLTLDDQVFDATEATRLFHMAQQIVLNYDHFSGNPANKSAGFDLIDSVADEIDLSDSGNSKLLLWTQYRMTSRAVHKYMEKYGKAAAAYGEVDSKSYVDKFENDPAYRSMTAQPQSAGAGWNPQYVCSQALTLELPTTTIPFKQLCGRIDRTGQKHVPVNHFAVASNTIQERLLAALLNNDDDVTKVLSNSRSIRSILFSE